MLLQWHVKDPSYSAKKAVGRLHLNIHTPFTQRSWSGLTVLMSRHSVGTYLETSSSVEYCLSADCKASPTFPPAHSSSVHCKASSIFPQATCEQNVRPAQLFYKLTAHKRNIWLAQLFHNLLGHQQNVAYEQRIQLAQLFHNFIAVLR